MESIQSALFTADPGPGLSQKRHACILRYEIFITRGGEMRDVSIFHSLLKLYYCCVTREAKKAVRILQPRRIISKTSARNIPCSKTHPNKKRQFNSNEFLLNCQKEMIPKKSECAFNVCKTSLRAKQ